jgi:AcrR family transcriptional regulator
LIDHSTLPVTPRETRTRILEAARRLFHEQGYAATGVATILREAGVHSGSLYHFFPSKEALLAGLLEHYPSLFGPLVSGPVEARVRDPVERVFALLGVYRRLLERSGCRLGCPIGNLALEVSDNHPEVRPLLERNFATWSGTVSRWLRESRRLPPGVDLDRLARFVLAVMEGAVMQARAAGRLAPFDATVEELRAHVRMLEASARGGAARPRARRRRRGGGSR